MTDKPTVLFVCVHNAGRSQMAAGYLRALARRPRRGAARPGPRRRTRSTPSRSRRWPRTASTSPANMPKILTVEAVRESDVVITMGCGDTCPIFPGKRYEDWELDDPAGQASTRCARSATRSAAASRKLVSELLADRHLSRVRNVLRPGSALRLVACVAGAWAHRSVPGCGSRRPDRRSTRSSSG